MTHAAFGLSLPYACVKHRADMTRQAQKELDADHVKRRDQRSSQKPNVRWATAKRKQLKNSFSRKMKICTPIANWIHCESCRNGSEFIWKTFWRMGWVLIVQYSQEYRQVCIHSAYSAYPCLTGWAAFCAHFKQKTSVCYHEVQVCMMTTHYGYVHCARDTDQYFACCVYSASVSLSLIVHSKWKRKVKCWGNRRRGINFVTLTVSGKQPIIGTTETAASIWTK